MEEKQTRNEREKWIEWKEYTKVKKTNNNNYLDLWKKKHCWTGFFDGLKPNE